MININCNLKKIMKYLVHMIVVMLLVRWIIPHKVYLIDILLIGFSASISLILLDLYTPYIVNSNKIDNYVD
jgi:hypothetical protein